MALPRRVMTNHDLTAVGDWWRSTWETNRVFSAALVAVLLSLLALAVAAGAFGATDAAGTATGTPSFAPIPTN